MSGDTAEHAAIRHTRSIQSTLLRALLLTAGSALVVASSAFLLLEATGSRNAAMSEMTTLANVIGLYSEAALEFDDRAAGNEALSALSNNEALASALLFDESGAVFARYGETIPGESLGLTSLSALDGDGLGPSRLELVHPIWLEGRLIGTLVLRRTTADIYNTLAGRAVIVCLVMLFALGLASIAAARLRARIAGPLAELARTSSAMAEGDLSALAVVVSDDEIGSLAGTFNRMGESLRELVSDIRKNTLAVSEETTQLADASRAMFAEAQRQEMRARSATESIETLGASVGQVNDTVTAVTTSAAESNHAMREIEASIGEISDRTEQLFEAVDKAVSSITELTASVRQVSESADGLSNDTDSTISLMQTLLRSVQGVEEHATRSLEACSQAAERAHSGEAAVRQTIAGMAQIEESFGGLDQEVQGLASHSQAIGEVLNVLDSVVGQTNLLALNAAIISSHAGEHGRGFSVVAQEIRALADRTSESTAEIRHAVEAVIAGVQRAVESVSTGAEHVTEGARRSREAGLMLGDIRASNEHSSEMAREIANATRSQTRDIATVSAAMDKVKDLVDQISGATHEQSRASTQIQHSVEAIRGLTEDVSRSTSDQMRQTQLTSNGVDQVSDDVGQILEATKAQQDSVNQILETIQFFLTNATEGTLRAESVNTSAERLSERSQDLESRVGRFSV